MLRCINTSPDSTRLYKMPFKSILLHAIHILVLLAACAVSRGSSTGGCCICNNTMLIFHPRPERTLCMRLRLHHSPDSAARKRRLCFGKSCKAGCWQVEHTLVYRNPDVPDCSWVEGRDLWWQDEIPSQASECAVEWVRPALLFVCSVSPLL